MIRNYQVIAHQHPWDMRIIQNKIVDAALKKVYISINCFKKRHLALKETSKVQKNLSNIYKGKGLFIELWQPIKESLNLNA